MGPPPGGLGVAPGMEMGRQDAVRFGALLCPYPALHGGFRKMGHPLPPAPSSTSVPWRPKTCSSIQETRWEVKRPVLHPPFSCCYTPYESAASSGQSRGKQSLSSYRPPCPLWSPQHSATLFLRACLPFSPLPLPLPVPCSSAPSLESSSCSGWTAQCLYWLGFLCEHPPPSERALPTCYRGNKQKPRTPILEWGIQQRHGFLQPQLCDLRKVAQSLWASCIRQSWTEHTPTGSWLGKAALDCRRGKVHPNPDQCSPPSWGWGLCHPLPHPRMQRGLLAWGPGGLAGGPPRCGRPSHMQYFFWLLMGIFHPRLDVS